MSTSFRSDFWNSKLPNTALQGGFGAYVVDDDEDYNNCPEAMSEEHLYKHSKNRSTSPDESDLSTDSSDDEIERQIEANAQKLKQEQMASGSSDLSSGPSPFYNKLSCSKSESREPNELTENEKNFIKMFRGQPIPPGEISRLKAKQKGKQSVPQQNTNYYNLRQRLANADPSRDFHNYRKDDDDSYSPQSNQGLSLREQITQATRHVDLMKLSLESVALINLEDPRPDEKHNGAQASLLNGINESRMHHFETTDENFQINSIDEDQMLSTLSMKKADEAKQLSAIFRDEVQDIQQARASSAGWKDKYAVVEHDDLNSKLEALTQSNSESVDGMLEPNSTWNSFRKLDWNGKPEIDWEGQLRAEKDKSGKSEVADSKSMQDATDNEKMNTTNQLKSKTSQSTSIKNSSIPNGVPSSEQTQSISHSVGSSPSSFTTALSETNNQKSFSVDANVQAQISHVNNLAAAITMAVMSSPEGCLRLSKLVKFLQRCYGDHLDSDLYDLMKLGKFIQENCGPNVTFNRRENGDALIVHRNLEDIDTSN